MINYERVLETIEALKKDLKKEIEKHRSEVEEMMVFLKKEFERRIEEKEIDAEVFLGGSTAKDTWVPDKIEFDVFIRIKNPEDLQKFYSICPEGEIMMGSRDYFRFKYKKFWVEVVPIKYIEHPEEAENITDLSPFHVDFVRSRTDEDMRMDIRLLKLFLKAKGIYGAETYIGGFSGYMTELLIISYGSLLNLFKNVEERWRSKVYIDLMHYYENLRDAMLHLGSDKVKGPILLVDPTFKYRNAAAALTRESYSRFIFEVRRFLRNPTKKQFYEKVIKNVKVLKKRSKERGSKIFFIEIEKEGKEDYFFGKIKRIVRRASELLERDGWKIYDSGFFVENGKVYLYFEFQTTSMSKKRKWMGPPVWVKGPHFDNFLEKHRFVYVDGDMLVADIDGKDIKETLLDILSLYDIKIKKVL